METTLFNGNFNNEPKTSRSVRKALGAAIGDLLNEKVKQQILLAASEVLVNINQHTTSTKVFLNLLQSSKGITLQVKDNATRFNPLEHEAPLLDDDSILLESSRGIGLIKTLSDSVTYAFHEELQMNELSLYWHCKVKGPKRKVLVLDDCEIQQAIYQEQLGPHLELFSTTDPVLADDIILSENIDLIICDLYMPNMNGHEFFKYINKNHNKSIPFIMITSSQNFSDDLYVSSIESGVDEFLTKPVSANAILSTIERIFNRRKIIDDSSRNIINKRITESLAPNIPTSFRHWNVALGSRNTGSGGGDFILHQPSFDSETLLLADIMGHDECAKFFSFAYAGYLRGLLFNSEFCRNTDFLLEVLSNITMNDRVLSHTMLTCCATNLGFDGLVSVSTAGHPAPLLVTSDSVNKVASSGIMLGILEHAEYSKTQFTLHSGQRLLMFTDGLFDSVKIGGSREALEQDLHKILMSTINLPIEIALDKLFQTFDEHNAEYPNDDVLAVLIEPKH